MKLNVPITVTAVVLDEHKNNFLIFVFNVLKYCLQKVCFFTTRLDNKFLQKRINLKRHIP